MSNFRVYTEFPVAVDSFDHIHPFGTLKDNNTNLALVEKFKESGVKSVLDIGCAGGLFVEDLLAAGINAIGLEGSDISKKTKRACWNTIPENLFTADVTKPFYITYDYKTAKFDVVTCWEFFEHIEEQDLHSVMLNILYHTEPQSQLICSIASFPSPHMGVDLHRTQKDKSFWLEFFENYGFVKDKSAEAFYEGNYVRYGSFNLVMRRIK